MNNLVDYGADSDEDSPRRRSSDAAEFKKYNEAEKKRRLRRKSDEYGDDLSPERDFVEPPPPKRITEHSPSPGAFRTPQMGLPNVSSQASLVSYSGEGDDDDLDSVISDKPFTDSAPNSVLHEPAPPVRQSMDAESDEEQKLIDLAIKEGNAAMLQRLNEDSSPSDVTDTPTRDFGVSSDSPLIHVPSNAHQIDDEGDVAGELRLPPPPDVEVNPGLVTRFEHAFRQKAGGTDLNQQIQGNQQYNNPMSYETFIEAFDIDEKGTNFAANIFDPHVFPENCFYDAIAEEQKKMTDAQQTTKKAK